MMDTHTNGKSHLVPLKIIPREISSELKEIIPH